MKTKCIDHFPKDSKLVCKVCTNGGKAHTVINYSSSLSAIGAKLNASNISKLPSEKELGCDDCIELKGSPLRLKRYLQGRLNLRLKQLLQRGTSLQSTIMMVMKTRP